MNKEKRCEPAALTWQAHIRAVRILCSTEWHLLYNKIGSQAVVVLLLFAPSRSKP